MASTQTCQRKRQPEKRQPETLGTPDPGLDDQIPRGTSHEEQAHLDADDFHPRNTLFVLVIRVLTAACLLHTPHPRENHPGPES